MKVLSIVLLVAVAAVVALPVEEKPEESVVLSNFEAEQAGIDVAQINELVRDKRNYGYGGGRGGFGGGYGGGYGGGFGGGYGGGYGGGFGRGGGFGGGRGGYGGYGGYGK